MCSSKPAFWYITSRGVLILLFSRNFNIQNGRRPKSKMVTHHDICDILNFSQSFCFPMMFQITRWPSPYHKSTMAVTENPRWLPPWIQDGRHWIRDGHWKGIVPSFPMIYYIYKPYLLLNSKMAVAVNPRWQPPWIQDGRQRICDGRHRIQHAEKNLSVNFHGVLPIFKHFRGFSFYLLFKLTEVKVQNKLGSGHALLLFVLECFNIVWTYIWAPSTFTPNFGLVGLQLWPPGGHLGKSTKSY
jgi:hypothetical protein